MGMEEKSRTEEKIFRFWLQFKMKINRHINGNGEKKILKVSFSLSTSFKITCLSLLCKDHFPFHFSPLIFPPSPRGSFDITTPPGLVPPPSYFKPL